MIGCLVQMASSMLMSGSVTSNLALQNTTPSFKTPGPASCIHGSAFTGCKHLGPVCVCVCVCGTSQEK